MVSIWTTRESLEFSLSDPELGWCLASVDGGFGGERGAVGTTGRGGVGRERASRSGHRGTGEIVGEREAIAAGVCRAGAAKSCGLDVAAWRNSEGRTIPGSWDEDVFRLLRAILSSGAACDATAT